MKTTLKNLILAALFAAMAVLLSGFSIDVYKRQGGPLLVWPALPRHQSHRHHYRGPEPVSYTHLQHLLLRS